VLLESIVGGVVLLECIVLQQHVLLECIVLQQHVGVVLHESIVLQQHVGVVLLLVYGVAATRRVYRLVCRVAATSLSSCVSCCSNKISLSSCSHLTRLKHFTEMSETPPPTQLLLPHPPHSAFGSRRHIGRAGER